MAGKVPVETIMPGDLKKRIASGEKIILVDVRQPEEHAEENIPNSILIPLGELDRRFQELEPYREQEIIVYCRSGNRSGHACQFLNQQGFRTVNLSGGMLQWS